MEVDSGGRCCVSVCQVGAVCLCVRSVLYVCVSGRCCVSVCQVGEVVSTSFGVVRSVFVAVVIVVVVGSDVLKL